MRTEYQALTGPDEHAGRLADVTGGRRVLGAALPLGQRGAGGADRVLAGADGEAEPVVGCTPSPPSNRSAASRSASVNSKAPVRSVSSSRISANSWAPAGDLLELVHERGRGRTG